MKLWIARDEDGSLNLFMHSVPHKEIYERVVMWENDEECGIISMDRTDFPEVTFENSPQEVELKLTKK